MTRHYVISDTHFGHENIIHYCGRPFTNTTQMDETLIANWNDVVRPEDHIYHLGDVTMWRGGRQVEERFIRLIRRLNGHKRLIMGNHDHLPIRAYVEAGFEKIRGAGQWYGNGLLFSHYPVHPHDLGFRVKANVHGHIHEKPAPPAVHTDGGIKRYINVSVEAVNYRPVEIDSLV